MNRKHFLSFLLTAGAVLPTLNVGAMESGVVELRAKKPKIPPYLLPGDTIGITSPASYISLEDIAPSVTLMKGWGYKIEIGSTVGKRDFTLGGTDEERAADFQQMLDNPNIKAIMCARGGYGVVRMIDKLDFSLFRKKPKWVIGFSDITLFHAHINSRFRIASIHSKMCNSFPADWTLATPMQIETILSIRQVLSGEPVKYTAPISSFNRIGSVQGILVGGNLSMIETIAGSESDLDTRDKILFLEDTREELYSLDRMLWNLKRSGKLDHLKGLIIGGFKLKEDAEGDDFGRSIYEIVIEKVKDFDYPVGFDFPVGHQVNNYALKCGAPHIMTVDEKGTALVSI